jgi:hypothetical protein
MNPEIILPAMLREERARNLAPELAELARMVVEASDLAGFSGPLGDTARALLAKIDGEQA